LLKVALNATPVVFRSWPTTLKSGTIYQGTSKL